MYENGVPICLACATDKAAKITPAERATAYGTMDRRHLAKGSEAGR